MENVYRGNWSNVDDMVRDFQISKDEVKGIKVLLAWYEYEDYSGSAFVLFRKDRKLYEVNGGHCSCYGLEGQWEPEETSVEAILKREFPGVNGKTVKALMAVLNTKY